jgi:trimeric autotransporter adhesin
LLKEKQSSFQSRKGKTMNSLIQFKTIASILVASALGSFALLPTAQAVVPPPDGGYAGGNTAEGQNALLSLTSGTFNTAVGLFSLLSNTEGNFNTAIGAGTLLANNVDTDENTAIGAGALLSNTIGSGNTANGAFALFSNTEGNTNTALGDIALFLNTTGSDNTATGFEALLSNTTGNRNTATGVAALSENAEGSNNSALGFDALLHNTTGNVNTALGNEALANNTTGNDNTATGGQALASNTEGDLNTAVGRIALSSNTTGDRNTALGNEALRLNTTGSDNIALGFAAGTSVTTANNVICIGHPGANVDDSCFIGKIRDAIVAPDAVNVLIDSAGKLGTTSGSSRRFKRDVKAMDRVSEAILALKPVTFHYNSDATDRLQFGLIAEEVAKVNPELVVRDENGELLTVRYDAVNAMLLNEFLKERKTVQELEKEIATVTARLKAQDAKIRKVTDQLEVSQSAPRMAVNRP